MSPLSIGKFCRMTARDQFKLLIPAKIIDLALGRDAKKNLD